MELEFNSFIFKENEHGNFVRERVTLIVVISFLLSILFFVLNWYLLGGFVFLGIFIFLYGMAFSRSGKPEPLNGSFPYRLSINSNRIVIDQKVFAMSDISIDRITCLEYRGHESLGYYLGFVKYISQANGTNNMLWFKTKEKEYKLKFLIESEKQYNELKEIKKQIGID